MHKRDYFIKALNAGAFRHKTWVLRAFSITRPSKTYKPEDDFDYQLTSRGWTILLLQRCRRRGDLSGRCDAGSTAVCFP